MNDRKAVIIYGAGRAGAQLIESLRKSHDYAVAFIDDESKKEQLSITALMYMVLRI